MEGQRENFKVSNCDDDDDDQELQSQSLSQYRQTYAIHFDLSFITWTVIV